MCSSSRRCARRTSPPTRIWSSSGSHSMVMDDGSGVGCLGWVGKRRKDWEIFWPTGGGRRKRNGDGRLSSDARRRQEARGREMQAGTTTRRCEGEWGAAGRSEREGDAEDWRKPGALDICRVNSKSWVLPGAIPGAAAPRPGAQIR
jgi:hypothetical protein